MKLYYTVASQPEDKQINPALSLGGYKSSSALQNSRFGNLFSDITPTTIKNFNQNQYIGLVLKNESGSAVTGIKIWFEFGEDCYCLFKISAVDMAEDTNGDLAMEHVTSQDSMPLSGDFYEASEEENAVDIGDLDIDGQVGIWIERSLLTDIISTQQEEVYEADTVLINRFKEVILPTSDEIKIGISWD